MKKNKNFPFIYERALMNLETSESRLVRVASKWRKVPTKENFKALTDCIDLIEKRKDVLNKINKEWSIILNR